LYFHSSRQIHFDDRRLKPNFLENSLQKEDIQKLSLGVDMLTFSL